jgi:hypothetical protein
MREVHMIAILPVYEVNASRRLERVFRSGWNFSNVLQPVGHEINT